MIARIIAALVALMMGMSAFGWITNPAGAAEGLGMPLLDGIGRSTQIGDFSAFFVGVTIFCLIGAIKQQTIWLYSAAIILGLAATMRTLAWVAHGADFATVFIVVETVMTILLLVSAFLMTKNTNNRA